MKRVIDTDGRILYKSSHSTAKGGNVYVNKTTQGHAIENKARLRDVLNEISMRFDLIDPTIKIYDHIFFLFFHLPKSLAPQKLIDAIQQSIAALGEWDEDYVFTGVYDLQERYLREDLKKWGYDYETG